MSSSNLNRWKTDPEYIELLNFLIERTENVKLPIYIQKLAREFKEKSGTALTENVIKYRIEKLRKVIHRFEHIEADTKVRMLFALSAPVNKEFLEKLSSVALVEVDEKNRITHYKSERLELKGYHRLSTTTDTKNYWTIHREAIDLLNYLIEATENVTSPMNLAQLARDFKEKSGTLQAANSLRFKIERMRKHIHSFEHIDTETKVRMLFAFSVPVNRDFLKKLSDNALVDVDEYNRITHYKSQQLELKGCHRLLTTCEIKSYWKNDMECIDLLNYLIEETKNVKSPMNLLQLATDFKEKTGALQTAESLEQRIMRVRFIIHSFDHIDTNTKVKLLFALSGPVNSYFLEELKKRAFVEVDQMNQITYYKSINDGLELRGDHSLPAKRSSEITISSPEHSSRELLVDYDTNNSIDDLVKLEPFRGEIQEDLNGIVDDKDIQQIPKAMETPIKTEVEKPIELKPEKSHNSKIKFFAAMQLLIISLDTPFLSNLQSKIHRKIQKLKGSDEVMLDDDLVFIIKIWTAGIINQSVVNLSDDVESVNLSNFLYYLKTAIQNSKMSGVEGLVKDISERIDGTQNKRIPMELLENALRTILNNHGF